VWLRVGATVGIDIRRSCSDSYDIFVARLNLCGHKTMPKKALYTLGFSSRSWTRFSLQKIIVATKRHVFALRCTSRMFYLSANSSCSIP
jgi:hypothetical protein